MADKIDLRGTPSRADQAFRGLAMGAACLVLLVLALIAIQMSGRMGPVFDRMGFSYFTSKRWSPAEGLFGALPFLWGTLYTACIAIVLSVPVSLFVALFVTQVASPRWRKPIVYVLDLLAVVPSVVYGLWGVLVLAQPLQKIFLKIHNAVDGIPGLQSIFGPTPQGRSFMTAGVILAIMITPIITSLAREVIETTPQNEKEAAYALGATRWEMIRASVWPHSKSGLVGAVMLGLGRAMGETIAAALVIGSSIGQITINAFAPGNSMPAVIANEWGEANDLRKSAMIALALLLFAITIIVNLVSSAIVQRSLRRSRGAL
ncbi:MAG TPA: phosphate ABC transporter permease subunit PstC [Kofleriaceae bacterium]|nr:phosphate ABC transporter permease subunit PstC [Kofleriaceae bacterium]